MLTDFLETGRKSYQNKHPKLIEAGEGRSGQGAMERVATAMVGQDD